jgi:hypothetical protein
MVEVVLIVQKRDVIGRNSFWGFLWGEVSCINKSLMFLLHMQLSIRLVVCTSNSVPGLAWA